MNLREAIGTRSSYSRHRNQSLHIFVVLDLYARLRRHEKQSACFYLMTSRGESGIEFGVPGKIIDGEPSLEYSNECECDNGGVWQICRQPSSPEWLTSNDVKDGSVLWGEFFFEKETTVIKDCRKIY